MSKKWLTGVVFPILVAIGSSAVVIDYLLAFIKIRLMPDVNWVGATYQPDGKGGYDVYTDSWVLDDSHGRVNTTITKDDTHSTWIGQGYSLHQVLSVAYKADQEKNSGIGTFYLARRGNREDYFGTQVYADCDVGKILSCPYVLVPKGGKELIKDADHQNFLRAGCTELKNVPVYACTSGMFIPATPAPTSPPTSSVSVTSPPTSSVASAPAK